MTQGLTAAVLVAMLHEEWRFHSALFGGRRFAAFPGVVAAAGTGTVWLLGWTGTSPARIALGLHLLVFVFGLSSGSAGLVGRDAMRNVLGEVTLVVFSGRTLPVSERRLLATFLVKDVAYYAALFLVPLAVAYGPAAVAAGTLGRLPLLWLTLTGTFVVGLVVALAGLAARTQGRAGNAALLVGGTALGLSWAAGVDLLGLLPYGFYRDPGATVPLVGLAVTAAAGAAALATFDPTNEPSTRRSQPRLSRWRGRLQFDRDGLLAKTLLDVGRSSGGFWKVLFSGGVLFVVTAALVGLAGAITGRSPSTGLSFGAVLGLSAFTSYNWVTQFDDLETYQAYPLSTAAVFEAKFQAFLVLGLPTAVGYYLLAVVIWGERPAVVLAGLTLLGGLTVYLFGLTVALAGLDPNEFLFDTVRFVAFTVGAALPLVPILVVAFVIAPTNAWLVGVAGAGLGLGGIGVGLFRWSVPRWTSRYRAG